MTGTPATGVNRGKAAFSGAGEASVAPAPKNRATGRKSVLHREHSAKMMSPKHAKRLADGESESNPSDYALSITPEGRRQRDARHRIEDMAMAKELGLDG